MWNIYHSVVHSFSIQSWVNDKLKSLVMKKANMHTIKSKNSSLVSSRYKESVCLNYGLHPLPLLKIG